MGKSIGKELHFIRKYRGLTLRELGKKTGIPYSRLGKFEGGKEIPTEELVLKIEKVLDISFNEYFEISKNIDIMFDEFLDSLFYYDDNNDLFKTRIANGKINSIINFSFGKVQLMEYIMYVLDEKFEKANRMETELLDYFVDDFECLALLYQYKGVLNETEKHYPEAISCFEKAEVITINRKYKAMLYLHSSLAYKKYGNIAKAMHYIELALRLFSEFGSLRRLAFTFVEYGLLLKANQQFDQAIYQFNIALRALEMIDCPESLNERVYRNMCWTMILAGDYVAALEYLSEIKEEKIKHGFTILYGIWCNYKLKNYDEAERWITENNYLLQNEKFCKFYELFTLLVKCRDNEPSTKLINSAINIVNDFQNRENCERINFYIDIVLDLLNRSGNELEKIKYLEMKVNLTKNH
ncbi:helix-turn-helix transcriptional regulator [Dielma fastidiosa]|uniref:Helix-turn-helix transcriptional regulator n=1 Tax=Dielma fastidiosa TaxID=1034346 RepID=A0AB35UQ44_9FIRM|nr:helix-turn-helix transcriptional regulator [Dielma fastidiosa]MDY5168875.1 helix-turn-helix transcriptional regulator [Dielma fastidiosa]